MNELVDAIYAFGSGMGFLGKALKALEGHSSHDEVRRIFLVIDQEITALDAILYPGEA